MDNFQLPEHVHYQQQYLNYAYQMLQNNNNNNNQIYIQQQQQQQQQQQGNSVGFQTIVNNNNVTSNLHHHHHQKLNQIDVYSNNNNNNSNNILNRNLQCQQQNFINQSQQQCYKPLSTSINFSSNNADNSLYMDNSQYWSTYSINQYQSQSQHVNSNSSNNNSMLLGQYLTKISQPVTNIPIPTSNRPPVYQNVYNVNQNQDYMTPDVTTRLQYDSNSKLLRYKDSMISSQTSEYVSKNECCYASKLCSVNPTNTQFTNETQNPNYLNNFISAASPASPIDFITTTAFATSASSSSSYAISLNDSGFISNPSSVDSSFSSKQSNISDLSVSYDEQMTDFDATNTNSTSTTTNISIETNTNSCSIKKKQKKLTKTSTSSNPCTSSNTNKNEDNNENSDNSLNVFICWMDLDESLLSDFELKMREILKQQSALNLYMLNNSDHNSTTSTTTNSSDNNN